MLGEKEYSNSNRADITWRHGIATVYDRKVVEKRTSIQVRGDNYSWTIGTPCNTIGAVKNGGKEYPLTRKSSLN